MNQEKKEKGFPKKILWFFIGWKDLGKRKNWIKDEKEYITLHEFCKNRARIGIENGEIFIYCPVCKIKLNNNQHATK